MPHQWRPPYQNNASSFLLRGCRFKQGGNLYRQKVSAQEAFECLGLSQILNSSLKLNWVQNPNKTWLLVRHIPNLRALVRSYAKFWRSSYENAFISQTITLWNLYAMITSTKSFSHLLNTRNSYFYRIAYVLDQTPFYRISNVLEHHFLNIKRTRTCSSISDRTWTRYFWLRTIKHRTSNLIGLWLDLLSYSSNSLEQNFFEQWKDSNTLFLASNDRTSNFKRCLTHY